MKTRNLRIGAMVATLVLGLVLVGAAKEWDYSGQSGYLSMSPSKLEAKPDGEPIKLLLSGMGKDGALLEGDVHITGECGLINGVAAKTGGRAYLSGGVGSAVYRCDAATEACCVGAQKFVAKLGSYEAGAAMSLRMDAQTSTGADAGTIGPATFSPDEVHFVGYLGGNSSFLAVTSVGNPNNRFIGFHSDDLVVGISRTGTILYKAPSTSETKLAEAVPDSWSYDEAHCLRYPSDPRKNDRILGSCDAALGFLQPVLVSPDSDAVFFKCSKAPDWKSTSGTVPAWFNETPPRYLGYEGTALVQSSIALQAMLRKSDGTVIDFWKSLPAPSAKWVRAHPKGYWLVVAVENGTIDQLWNLDFEGTLSKVGDYADLPEGIDEGPGLLDGTGTRYFKTIHDAIVRIPVKPEKASIVYTSKDTPPDWCEGVPWIEPDRLITGAHVPEY